MTRRPCLLTVGLEVKACWGHTISRPGDPCPRLQDLLAYRSRALCAPHPMPGNCTRRSPEPTPPLPPGFLSAVPSARDTSSFPSPCSAQGVADAPTVFPQPLGFSLCQPTFIQQIYSLNNDAEALLMHQSRCWGVRLKDAFVNKTDQGPASGV